MRDNLNMEKFKDMDNIHKEKMKSFIMDSLAMGITMDMEYINGMMGDIMKDFMKMV
jgi:hypothetical protein